jgi:hypothetical protein
LSELRSRALFVAVCFGATLAYGLLLLFAFDTDIQQIDAAELADRTADARAFLIADLFFPVFYAVLSPIAQLRFGVALSSDRDAGNNRPPGWIIATAALLAGAGLFDWAENVLLLIATGSGSQGTVDAAHAVAIPKTVLFVSGALLALFLLARAIKILRRPDPDSPPPAG